MPKLPSLSSLTSFSLPAGPLPCAIALAAGIAAAPHLDPAVSAPMRWAIAFALVAAAGLRWRRLALVAVIAVGAARGARPPVQVPPDATLDDRIEDRIEGVIAGPVMRTRRGFGARLEAGGIAVWLWTDEPVASGERIAVTGFLRTPRGSLGPAQPDRADALRTLGAQIELVARAGSIERLADAPGGAARIWRWAADAQAGGSAAIERAGGDPAARAALRGISVGDRTDIPPELDARWRAVGIYHVLSVSGLHLAVVAGLAFTLLRRLIAASPWGGRARPARWAAPPALAIAVAYTLITGAQLATLRALIVVAVVLAAAALDRPVRLTDALGLAALVLLGLRPADLLDPGFQLSFTAALTLALRPAGARRGGVVGWIARAASASAWISVTTAPITAYHFHEVAPFGVAGNVVLTPPVELLALPLALGGLAIGWDAPVRLATLVVELADGGAGLLAHVAPVGRVALTGALLPAALVALSLWIAGRPRSRAAAVAWALLCVGWALGREPPPPGALRVSFLDIGQGDATVVELPDGAVWLVDAGGVPSARDAAAAVAPGRTIRRTLAAYGHARVDLAIVSHPHPDHYLGLAGLEVPIGELWLARELEPPPEPPRPYASDGDAAGAVAVAPLPRFDDVLADLRARGTRLVHPPLGAARRQAGVELVVWGPRYQAVAGGPILAAADPVRSVNDNSLVVELRYRGRSILLLGDLEAEGEALLAEAGPPRADVVKVAHHGSPTSSTAPLVAAARPALAVISCGRANRFGFPAPAVVARGRAAGADVARTDTDGTITVTVDARGALHVDRF
ncbi:MAG TPA: ComEC/Rec2 family competence protein, partial [Kofleriaceae bacterium]|nr:ComEC/Rec2 family competence protein [Kofleriaceae bacterium]